MATTGFWPIKGNLKDALDYAKNPDKTTKTEYLDSDLTAVLQYAENSDKTDRQLFVSAINCSKHTAYSQMMAVKRKFGERGKNIAYHGYQSFQTGEVSPEEAHAIGLETARRMWGAKYQVVVTTHLNTDNLHNHFVVNSVSFRDGMKFRNKIGNHMELREISDDICREHGKSVLENSNFYGGEKGAYWLHKSGKQTHQDILKADIEECLKYSRKYDDLLYRLKAMGYQLDSTDDRHQHLTVKAPDWQRPVRLDRLGYTKETIEARFEEHWDNLYFFQIQNEHRAYRPTQFPLEIVIKDLQFDIEHSYDTATILVNTMFLLLLTVVDIIAELSSVMLLSPELRFAVKDIETHVADYHFLKENGIRTIPELSENIAKTKTQIATLEADRDKVSNKIRRSKSPEEQAENKEKRKTVTNQITPLRKKLKQAERILEKSPHLYELLQTEHRLEKAALHKLRERNYER